MAASSRQSGGAYSDVMNDCAGTGKQARDTARRARYYGSSGFDVEDVGLEDGVPGLGEL